MEVGFETTKCRLDLERADLDRVHLADGFHEIVGLVKYENLAVETVDAEGLASGFTQNALVGCDDHISLLSGNIPGWKVPADLQLVAAGRQLLNIVNLLAEVSREE